MFYILFVCFFLNGTVLNKNRFLVPNNLTKLHFSDRWWASSLKNRESHLRCGLVHVISLIWVLQQLWLVHPSGCHAWVNKLNPDHLCSCLVTWEKVMIHFHLQLLVWKPSSLVSLIRMTRNGKNIKKPNCVISLSVLSILVLRQTHFLSSITLKAFGQWSDPGRLSLAEALSAALMEF